VLPVFATVTTIDRRRIPLFVVTMSNGTDDFVREFRAVSLLGEYHIRLCFLVLYRLDLYNKMLTLEFFVVLLLAHLLCLSF
jgi:hypothetical protein